LKNNFIRNLYRKYKNILIFLGKSILAILFIIVIFNLSSLFYTFYKFKEGFGIETEHLIQELPNSRSGIFNFSVQKEIPIKEINGKSYSIKSLRTLNDNSIIVAGYYKLSNSYGTRTWIAKFNSSGEKEWEKVLGSVPSEYGHMNLLVSNKAIFLTREIRPGSFDNHETIMRKLNIDGTLLWKTSFDGKVEDVIQIEDNYLFIGIENNSNETDTRIIDTNGDLLWQKKYKSGIAKSIMRAIDGGYIIAGMAKNKDADIILGYQTSDGFQKKSNQNAWVIKIDEKGEIEWEHIINRDSDDLQFIDIATNDQGDIFLAGDAKYGYKVENNSIILLKLNKDGNLVWNSLISGKYYDSLNSISTLNDNNIFISANTTSLGSGEANGWLIKVDDKGKIIEDSTTNSLGTPTPMGYLHAMGTSQDDSIYIAGEVMNEYPNLTKNVVIYKIKSNN
jgi:predicted secreted protein